MTVTIPAPYIVNVMVPTLTATAPCALLARYRPRMSLTCSDCMMTSQLQGRIEKRACSKSPRA